MPYIKTERSTMHGSATPHGAKVPHRYPTAPGGSFTDIFGELTRQLYPTGRAWWQKRNGVFDMLHKALNRSFIRVVEDANFTIDSAFPDNPNFDEDDATLWEYRLGLINGTGLPIDVRRDNIRRKMAFPGNVRARQHPLFIQSQLQAAGFDVYVHENKFFEGGEWVYKTPQEIGDLVLQETQHSVTLPHGENIQHGDFGFQVIANFSSPTEIYNVGDGNLWATFFIGGEVLGEPATVLQSRMVEFRELVLKLKPAHTVAFTFINS